MFSIWDSITTETQIKLSNAGIAASFNKPKNDDSHVKAKKHLSIPSFLGSRGKR